METYMILAGHDEQSRLDAGRLELGHNPVRLLKRTLHRQAQLIPHARKQLQVCTKMQRKKKGPATNRRSRHWAGRN